MFRQFGSERKIEICIPCFLIGVFFILCMTGCMLNSQQVILREYKKDPRHISNVPPQEALPIDGVWVNPYEGEKYMMDRGRLYLLGQGTPQAPAFQIVTVKDIKRVGAGKYKGVGIVWGGAPVTFSIVSEDKLLQRTFRKEGPFDIVFDKFFIPVPRQAAFLSEYNAFLRESQGKQLEPIKTSASGIKIYNVKTMPVTMAPGAKFDLIIEYMVTELSVKESQIPVTFGMKILKQKKIVHTFEPSNVLCPNGEKTSRSIHLNATKTKGEYSFVVSMKYKNQSAEKSTRFIVR